MNFAGIGKIGAFVKQKNLIFAANYKIKTGQRLVDDSGRFTFSKATMFDSVKTSKKNSVTAADKARLAAIKQKLKSGKKLSEAEMNYLREKDEKLYKKAKYADEAREELKKELKQATTKDEARQAVMRATAKIAADCSADFEALKSGGGGAGISFGGDISADMSSVGNDISVDGGIENLSAENISNGEIANFSNTENVKVADNENAFSQNENSVNQNSPLNNEESDSAADILDKYIYAIRAIQDEWLQFIKSDKYKNMPENIFEEHADKKISVLRLIDAMSAYGKG